MKFKEFYKQINRREFLVFFASFLALFAEMLFIRWLPLRLRLLAYYTNIVLIASLFGMGLGLVLFKMQKKRLFKAVAYFSAFLTLVAVGISQVDFFVLPFASENNFIWNGLSRAPDFFGPLSYLVLAVIFLSVVFLFILFGHEMGFQIENLKPLRGYSLNILGSIVGVALFSAVSAFSSPPFYWFLFLCSGVLVYALIANLWRKKEWISGFFIIFIILGAVFFSTFKKGESYVWSPYYEIKTEDLVIGGQKVGFNVRVNQDSHQQAIDLSGKIMGDYTNSKKYLYELPYSFINGQDFSRVLILGAGTGNDVAAALRKGADKVDAVEIDPLIAEIGDKHPERPYADPRVHLVIDDARAFLERNEEQYDAIIFGFLDSHRLFSSMSSVRLENYLYTVENIKRVKSLLKPDGVLAITYTVHEQWIADRIFNLLRSTFGHSPLVYQGDRNSWGTVFLISQSRVLEEGAAAISREEFDESILPYGNGYSWAYSEKSGFLSDEIFSASAVLPTDDWPHLFLKEPGLPGNYTAIIVILSIIAFALAIFKAPSLAFRSPGYWIFFLFGAAFTLLETKGITELALVIGSTWLTNAAVIIAVLVMILAANLIVIKKPAVNTSLMFFLLFFFIIFNFLSPLTKFFDFSYLLRVIFSVIQISLPILFSGILFAFFFKRTPDISTALGANLIGTVFGGFLEYSSLIFGQKILFLVALIFYAVAAAIYLKSGKKYLNAVVPIIPGNIK